MHVCRQFLARRSWCEVEATHVAFGNASAATRGFYCEAHAPAKAITVEAYDQAQSLYVAEIDRLARSGRGRPVSNAKAAKAWRKVLGEVT